MAFCPNDCAEITLVDNPTAGCDLKMRKRSIDRIGFFSCKTEIPETLTCASLEPLIGAAIVFSSPLSNVEFQDPQFEELQLADCRPAERIITRRTVTFQDRIAVELPAAGEDPANPFYDYAFWKDKRSHKAMLRYLFLFCDGSVIIPKEANGAYMEASFDIFQSFERQGSGGSSYILEIKKGQLDFKGDPLDFNTPAVNIYDTGCNIQL